jgi:death-on-curing protein
MRVALLYPSLEQAMSIHTTTLEKSGGGLPGAKDLGQLESVLEHIQNDEYYPTFEDKLTHLFFSLAKFHTFNDGNKRLSAVLSLNFLLLNGHLHCAGNFIPTMENISVHVAKGKIDKPLLRRILVAHIEHDDDNEILKLDILQAIDDESDGLDLTPICDANGQVLLYDIYVDGRWLGSRRTKEQCRLHVFGREGRY